MDKKILYASQERERWKDISKEYHRCSGKTALHDPQSGFYHPFYFETRMQEEMKRAKRYHFPVTLLILRFIPPPPGKKNLVSVEKLWRELGHVLCKNVRASDLIAPIGETKLGLLLPHTTQSQAKKMGDRLKEILNTHPALGNENGFLVEIEMEMLSREG